MQATRQIFAKRTIRAGRYIRKRRPTLWPGRLVAVGQELCARGGGVRRKALWAALAAAAAAWPLAQAASEAPPAPAVSITLGPRHGHATPERLGFTHTGAGTIDVAQPAPDTVVVTMTGAVMAGPHPCTDSVAGMRFELAQAFEVALAGTPARPARVSLEARAIGLLRARSACLCWRAVGRAEMTEAQAAVTSDCGTLVAIALPAHGVTGEDLSINDHDGPAEAPIVAGKYTLQESWALTASHPRRTLPAAHVSAEFAPDPALDPLWLGTRESFHGANKKDLGFQVTLRVSGSR